MDKKTKFIYQVDTETQMQFKLAVAQLSMDIGASVSMGEINRQLIGLFINEEKVYEKVKAILAARAAA